LHTSLLPDSEVVGSAKAMVGISMPRTTWNFIALNVGVVGEERLRTVTFGSNSKRVRKNRNENASGG
jgi:hypothetical protein